jgi:hypothetical protein
VTSRRPLLCLAGLLTLIVGLGSAGIASAETISPEQLKELEGDLSQPDPAGALPPGGHTIAGPGFTAHADNFNDLPLTSFALPLPVCVTVVGGNGELELFLYDADGSVLAFAGFGKKIACAAGVKRIDAVCRHPGIKAPGCTANWRVDLIPNATVSTATE